MILVYIIIALFAASVGSILLAGSLLLLKTKWLEKVSSYLLYLSGGTLLGAALLMLLPEATESMSVHYTLIWVLVGILFFFLLEKFILWRMCHDKECERQIHTAGPMILIGDAVHNAIDGIVIAAAFVSSPELGWFVTLSVVLHEVPQELGDFGILIKSGYSRGKAMLYNLLSGSTAIIAGIAAYFLLGYMQHIIPYALAFAAASFLYIAMADLIPEMHKETSIKETLIQFLLILLGVFIIFISVASHSHTH